MRIHLPSIVVGIALITSIVVLVGSAYAAQRINAPPTESLPAPEERALETQAPDEPPPPLAVQPAAPEPVLPKPEQQVEVLIPRDANVRLDVEARTLTADVPFNIVIVDPGDGVTVLRTLRVVAEDIDLTAFATSSLSAEEFFDNAFDAAEAALTLEAVTLSDTVIEGGGITTDETGAFTGFTIDLNTLVTTPSFSTRVRLTLDGMLYTALDPSTVTLGTLLINIMDNVEADFPPPGP